MLRNELYMAGRKVWERHKGKFEPVVNEDLFAGAASPQEQRAQGSAI